MGNPILASVFKGIIDSYAAAAANLEAEIEKLNNELEAIKREINELIYGNETGEDVSRRVVDLGKRSQDIENELDEIKKRLDAIYKQIGIYAIQYFKYAD